MTYCITPSLRLISSVSLGDESNSSSNRMMRERRLAILFLTVVVPCEFVRQRRASRAGGFSELSDQCGYWRWFARQL